MSSAEQFWNASAGNYDRTEERFEYIHLKSREHARRHLAAADIVLDYGCGTGTTSCEVAHLVKEIQAIDISSEMVEIARKKANDRGIENARFEQKDIFDEGYEPESFDVILMFNVLHTIPDPGRAMRRAHELLKPGGLVVSVTPCFRDKASLLGRMQTLLVRALCATGLIPIPIRSVGSADLHLLAESGGFEIVDTEVIFKGISSYFMVGKKTPADQALSAI
ncbi:MAG: class I SAM-dependent methyltransferase [Myxococcales bacterium]|nr:class I SAM-dependent methyltransferase [Myxococcales bacterium]